MGSLAVTAVGADRPGIIARITGVLSDRGGNLEDCSMTVLSGHFAIMLLVDIDADAAAVESTLTEQTADLGLMVTVRPVGEGHRPAPPTHMLTVYGSDRPGIVQQVAAALASADVNITDLTTRVLEGEQAVYAMAIEVAVPATLTADELTQRIARSVEDVEISLQALDAAVM